MYILNFPSYLHYNKICVNEEFFEKFYKIVIIMILKNRDFLSNQVNPKNLTTNTYCEIPSNFYQGNTLILNQLKKNHIFSYKFFFHFSKSFFFVLYIEDKNLELE